MSDHSSTALAVTYIGFGIKIPTNVGLHFYYHKLAGTDVPIVACVLDHAVPDIWPIEYSWRHILNIHSIETEGCCALLSWSNL